MTKNKDDFLEKNKKIKLLDSTVTLLFQETCSLEFKDLNTLEVTFSKERYQVLGINIQCFDNPKLNSETKIKKYLIDDEEINFSIERKGDVFCLNYEVAVEKEKLVIYKLLSVLKPRNFRLLRFAITWPDSKQAKKVVDPILAELPKIIEKVKFNSQRTKYDDLASLDYNLSNARLISNDFWNIFKLGLPLKWRVNISNNNEYAQIIMDLKGNFSFLVEKFFVNTNSKSHNNEKNTDKLVENLIKEITKEVNITNAKLKKADENNYLFYFIASEIDINDSTKVNKSKIWYRIKVLEDKIVIISFVFELISDIELENELYLEKLNQIIGAAEILV